MDIHDDLMSWRRKVNKNLRRLTQIVIEKQNHIWSLNGKIFQICFGPLKIKNIQNINIIAFIVYFIKHSYKTSTVMFSFYFYFFFLEWMNRFSSQFCNYCLKYFHYDYYVMLHVVPNLFYFGSSNNAFIIQHSK